jgi:hypothetical protein
MSDGDYVWGLLCRGHRWLPVRLRTSDQHAFSAQLYIRMAEVIREGKFVSPDFDVAVKRHQFLDVIQKASDTGIRRIL